MNKQEEDSLAQISAFEISKKIIEIARKNKDEFPILDAGRGDPNWINVKGRLALNRLVDFGIEESKLTFYENDLAGYIAKEGIGTRFKDFLDSSNYIDRFLLDVLNYVNVYMHFDIDDFVFEFINGALGNNYPSPNRALKYTEKIINNYLQSVLYNGKKLADNTDLFLTEGGTAAIVYIFNSLKENYLLNPGDKIAINTPIFTPYLEIPSLNDYQLIKLDLTSKEKNNWELEDTELDKLKDPSIKAFFLVNPSNPGSRSLNSHLLKCIEEVVSKNPNLIIITDDVYGTFSKNFQSVYSVVPKNTLLVYSFSKLFGATGWRLGIIAAYKNNIFDKLISKLPKNNKIELNKRYGIVDLNPEKMKFIDRIVADSRSIGLYHTAGLSTPQQIMSALFSLTHLILKDKTDEYILKARNIVNKRHNILYKSLGIPINDDPNDTDYYAMINVYKLAKLKYGNKFCQYLKNNYSPIDFLIRLAEKFGIILMYGKGFGAQGNNLRVSDANLTDRDYKKIGSKIIEVINDYYSEYKNI